MEEKDVEREGTPPDGKIGSDVKMSSPVLKKLDNFWYHYKWHTLIALFAILITVICTFQLCSKPSYDVHILYAGYYNIDRTQTEDGSLPEYNTFLSSFKQVGGDFDGNGEISISLATHRVMSEAKRDELYSAGDYVSEALVTSDRKDLYDRMLYSEYYLCILSTEVYDDCMKKFDGDMGGRGLFFVDLSEYMPEGADVEYYGEYNNAVKLNSLEFSRMAGLCNLPEDTVLCLRFRSGFTSVVNDAESEENYRRSIEVLKNILSMEAGENGLSTSTARAR